jgi:hypothetical protein
MTTNSSETFNLNVQTGDEAAEVFIIDSQFHRVAKGVGDHVSFKLPSGLYTIKVRAGCDTREKSISLFEDKSVYFEPIEFSSPAPLEKTGKTHEFHIGNAVSNSRVIHVKLGQNSQLYVFVRVWTAKNPSSTATTLNRDPCTGLTLRNLEDQVLVDFANPDIGSYTTDWEAWSACNVELDPGTYFLCLETASSELFKQTIITSPSWQTQIFLLQRNYGIKEQDVRADLTNSSIFISRIDQGFQAGKSMSGDPNEPNFRLTEMTRQALANNRNVITKEIVEQKLNEKFDNPMLGIYAAHLLLLNKEHLEALNKVLNKPILEVVVETLRNLLGQPHPDVEAIALKSTLSSNYVFNAPPMLCLSWKYILEASVHKPELVPENSLASQIAGQLCSSDLWLMWLQSQNQDDDNKIILEQLKKFIQAEEASIDTSNLSPGQVMTMAINKDINTGDVHAQSMPQLASHEPISYSYAPEKAISSEQLKRMVQVLGVPRSKLESLLKSIDVNQQNKEGVAASAKVKLQSKVAKSHAKRDGQTKRRSNRSKK